MLSVGSTSGGDQKNSICVNRPGLRAIRNLSKGLFTGFVDKLSDSVRLMVEL